MYTYFVLKNFYFPFISLIYKLLENICTWHFHVQIYNFFKYIDFLSIFFYFAITIL